MNLLMRNEVALREEACRVAPRVVALEDSLTLVSTNVDLCRVSFITQRDYKP